MTGMSAQAAGLVGRTEERRFLATAIEQSARGRPSATLVCGEAGVGKTSLVTAVTEACARRGHLVLWGRCLRFGADSSPYLPVGQLLTQWHRHADASERARVLQDAHGLATIAPQLAHASHVPVETGQVVSLASAVIDRICEATPTVLVIDDLQWADTSSLDLLAYILAGLSDGQRLALLGTYRETDLGAGHRLHGWLADVCRLPSVSRLPLDRLGLLQTEELVAALCGTEASTGLAADLYARSRGNPYLVELLAQAPPASGGLPGGADQRLGHVLLASWHRLTGPTRLLMQLLAVGGRPVALSILQPLAEEWGLDSAHVRPAVSEATDEGIATVHPGGEMWFRHPLLGEVIATTLAASDLVQIHDAYVRVWETAGDLPLSGRAAHLSLHHYGAGHADQAFTWALRAAEAAHEVHGYAEEFQHLHRACQLWPRVSAEVRRTATDEVTLLGRASDSAMRAGEYRLALDLREAALGLIDWAGRPLEVARLLFPLPLLKEHCGVAAGIQLEEMQAMLSVTEPLPQSPEHAIALAHLAFGEVWNGRPEAPLHAEQAVQLARRLGSDEALAWGLGVRSQTRWATAEGLDDAERSVDLARRGSDRLLFAHAALWRSNCLESLGLLDRAATSTLDAFREVMADGSFYEAIEFAPSAAAHLIELGRWPEAQDLLREILSRRLQSRWGGVARAAAADLAWRQGDLPSAGQHLLRAKELSPQSHTVGNGVFDVEVRMAVASHDPATALELIEEVLPITVPVDPDAADQLLMWAARAACDLTDGPGGRERPVSWLHRIERLRGEDPPPFAAHAPTDHFHPAHGRVFAAERARCHGEKSTLAELYEAATASCAAAGLPWEQSLAAYRQAQALLASGRGRSDAAARLRLAYRIAGRLGAAPIVADVAALARQARISLAEPVDEPAAATTTWPSLTTREREVLGHLVAGRTYAEIAAALFITEKTVSVHVSNMLRKTRTTNRIELAQLARRTASGVG